ncbi:hypothetical protein Daus18300_000563 [Diaporthe australafricana]|uniref:Uncharacterized protein n=1 Tax=Diaporthe australafricana TaxID=127596 RepID=A0ABR3Y3P4_9PEZI
MASTSPFHMPGAYHFSEPTTASTTLNANMFRPPVSPDASTYNLSKSTGSMLSDNTSANNNTPAPKLGRKRTYDESRGSSSYFDKVSTMEDSARGQDRYTLAGQIETPGTQVTPGSARLDDSLYSDIDYRRRLELGSKRPHDDETNPTLDLSNLALANTSTPITPRAAGWTTFAFQAIGGVVGKVWEFCRGGAGTFQGFQAGGGKAYVTNGQPVNTPLSIRLSTDLPSYSHAQENPLSPPGAFPVASDVISYLPDSIPDYQDHRQEEIYRSYEEQEQQEQQQVQQQQLQQQQQQAFQREESPDTTPERPAAKRRQTGTIGESDELKRNWVMVDENEEQSPAARRPALNTKRSSLTSVPQSRLPARSANMASRLQQPRPFSTPTKTPGPINPAARRFSVTSPRFGFEQKSGIQPPRSASRMSMASNASYAGGSITSPILGAGETASFASPRSPSRSTPATPSVAVNGSRIPQPKGLGLGPNPFANIRTLSPNNQRNSPSRPTSRHSVRHSIHHSPLTPSFIPRSGTPAAIGHRRSATSLSAGRGAPPGVLDMELSPRLDDEAKKLAAKRAAAEKRNTSRLDKLNGELQALIRQGQAALDTEFDVQMGDDDGWDEDVN